jgi:hypothetical protein
MSVQDGGTGQRDCERVRDLLRRCGATSDPAERAALLTRVAIELDQRAQGAKQDGDRPENIAALRGQASLARYMAEQERTDRARRVAGMRVTTEKRSD